MYNKRLSIKTLKKKAQVFDRVIGMKSLPTIEDDKDLPYTPACMKETLRWLPTTLLGAVLHSVPRDNWYVTPRVAGMACT
jgi:hypothetical protein